MSDGAPVDPDLFKDDDPLSLEEAARILLRGLVSASTLRAAAGRGELTYERIGRRLIVTPAAVCAWRERCQVTAKDPTFGARSEPLRQLSHGAGLEGAPQSDVALAALMSKLERPSRRAKSQKAGGSDGCPRRSRSPAA